MNFLTNNEKLTEEKDMVLLNKCRALQHNGRQIYMNSQQLQNALS